MIWIMDTLELLSFVIGLIYWNKFRGSAIKWFILFLGYNFLNEMIAGLFYVKTWVDSNVIFFNIRYLVYFGLLFSLYGKQLQNRKYSNATFFLLFLWFTIFIYWFSITNAWLKHALIPGLTGGFFLLGIILFYLIETINHRSMSFLQSDFFTYLSLGLLLESVVQLPVLITIFVGWAQLTDENDVRNSFFNTIRQVSFAASCIMYLVFIYGFYKAKPKEVKS